jgi:hypothetical protein
MKLTALGYVRVKSPDTAWARVDALNTERSGRWKPQAQGCLMGHSSRRLGKPTTRRRTPRKYVARFSIWQSQNSAKDWTSLLSGWRQYFTTLAAYGKKTANLSLSAVTSKAVTLAGARDGLGKR